MVKMTIETINSDEKSKCQIIESYGTCGIKKAKEGQQSLELTLSKWYGGPARLDLRWWNGYIPGKGVTFSAGEAAKLLGILKDMEKNGMFAGEEQ